MKKMQCHHLKIIALTLFLGCYFSNSFSQISSHRLSVADSLFKTKRYTQSFEQYQSILQQKQYTPAMLLKMAYIQEGLNNIGQSMYYLNLYLLASNDKSVLTKMETMAEKYNLKGYEATDADTLLTYYHDHHLYVTIFLAALCTLLISLVVYSKKKSNKRPIASAIVTLLFLVILFAHLNFGERITTGIILHPNTFVMEGPSAGAPVAEVVDEGHRVEVLGSQDVWLKVLWDGETAFIKSNQVLTVEL